MTAGVSVLGLGVEVNLKTCSEPDRAGQRMSQKTAKGVQATPAAPAAIPENATVSSRQQVMAAAVKEFSAYHGLIPEATGATDETAEESGAPSGEPVEPADDETVLSQTEETPADPQEGEAGADEGDEGEGEAEGAETAEDANEAKGKDDDDDIRPDDPKGVAKRITKLKERHQTEVAQLTERLKELEAKVGEPAKAASTGAQAPGAYDPIAAQPEVADLTRRQQEQRALLDGVKAARADLESNPDRVLKFLRDQQIPAADEDAARRYLEGLASETDEALQATRMDLSHARRMARQAVDGAKAQAGQVAAKEFPWINSKEDPRATLRQNALKELGPFANHPTAGLFTAVWADWMHNFQKRQSQPTTPATKPTTPKAKPTVRQSPAPPPPKQGGSAGVSNQSGKSSTAGSRSYFDQLAAEHVKGM